ncbi:hypothetical protein DIURU_001716 [Diutina rugosa]|uniref:Uncharacterized protein n=1 Tax=Diutina rugosa TaxID=5481 RepID=A0A642V0G4_DIURU|nr:uncharacterized protein DIURU_001716 [Diutina rugosa]KAA8905288.1 hypothetical protein DIURU_001716 [Diutina rugosa]
MAVKTNFVGLVVSQGKMNKTVKVRVNTHVYDKKVHKEVIKRNHYLVHDEGNICKEGDIVRIESIPKISPRKYFAVAEIKVNKGQQFAQYELEAKSRVAEEHKRKLAEFEANKEGLQSVISKIEDLRLLDGVSKQISTASDEDAAGLAKTIDEIKAKYGLKSWPTTQPIVNLEINEMTEKASAQKERQENVDAIVAKVLSDDSIVASILSKVGKDASALKKHTRKNLIRKYVLDVKNELPVNL